MNNSKFSSPIIVKTSQNLKQCTISAGMVRLNATNTWLVTSFKERRNDTAIVISRAYYISVSAIAKAIFTYPLWCPLSVFGSMRCDNLSPANICRPYWQFYWQLHLCRHSNIDWSSLNSQCNGLSTILISGLSSECAHKPAICIIG